MQDSWIGEDWRNKKESWIHVNQLLDSLQMDQLFRFQGQNSQAPNFKLYYQDQKGLELLVL